MKRLFGRELPTKVVLNIKPAMKKKFYKNLKIQKKTIAAFCKENNIDRTWLWRAINEDCGYRTSSKGYRVKKEIIRIAEMEL